jgi:hypothetical protein
MPFLAYLAIMIISSYLAAALAPKPPEPKPGSVTDLGVPTAEEGRAIPVVFGTAWIKDSNVVWYGNLRTTKIVSKSGK